MTPAQQDRLLGFHASLTQRGVVLTTADDSSFSALVEPVEPQTDDFELGPAQRHSSRVHLLRDEFVAQEIAVNDILTFGERRLRVLAINDNPVSITVILTCELL